MRNNKKENKRLPMPGKVKKGFRCYCTLVMAAALLGFGFANNMLNISLNAQAVGVETLYGRSIMVSSMTSPPEDGGTLP